MLAGILNVTTGALVKLPRPVLEPVVASANTVCVEPLAVIAVPRVPPLSGTAPVLPTASAKVPPAMLVSALVLGRV